MNFASEIRSYKTRLKYLREKIFRMKPSHSKLKLIDLALEKTKIQSFADLGGVWGVDGFYSFYILSKRKILKAYMIDDHFTKKVVKQAMNYSQLQLKEGDFRLRETFQEIDKVDLILLFDVLLHQVNWREVVSFCTEKANSLAVYNPQFFGERSLRLLDLGEEEYFNLVPHSKNGPYYEDLFTPLEQRDTAAVWQWGISDKDLISTLNQFDFRLSYSVDGEYWPNRAFRSKGFIFQRAR